MNDSFVLTYIYIIYFLKKEKKSQFVFKNVHSYFFFLLISTSNFINVYITIATIVRRQTLIINSSFWMLCDEPNRFWSPAFFLLLCVAYCCNKQDYDLLPNTRTPTANWFSLLLLLLPLLYRILKTVVFLFSFFFLFLFIPLRLEQTFAFLVQALLVSPNVHTHSLHFASYNATSRSANKHYKIGYNRRRDPKNVAFSAITGKQIQQLSSAQHYGEEKKKKKKSTKFYQFAPLHFFLSLLSFLFLIHAYLRFPLGNLPVLYIYRLQASKPTLQCAVKQGVCSVNTMQKMPGC